MSQTPSARRAQGVIAAIAVFTLIGLIITVASLPLFLSHKGAAFGLIPGFMGLVVSLWGGEKLVRLLTTRSPRGAA